MSIEEQKAQPKKVTVDGQTVENRSIEELQKADADAGIATAKANGTLPLKFIQFRTPGAVR